MLDDAPGKVTQLLKLVGEHEAGAANRLWTAVHRDLRAMAGAQMAHEPNKGTPGNRAVHDAYLKLLGSDSVQWNNREHFRRGGESHAPNLRDDARRRSRLSAAAVNGWSRWRMTRRLRWTRCRPAVHEAAGAA